MGRSACARGEGWPVAAKRRGRQPRARAAAVALPRVAARGGVDAAASRSCPRGARSASGSPSSPSPEGSMRPRARAPSSPFAASRCRARSPDFRRRCGRRSRRSIGTNLLALDGAVRRTAGRGAPGGALGRATTGPSRTRSTSPSFRRSRWRCCDAAPRAGSCRRAGGWSRGCRAAETRRCRGSGFRRPSTVVAGAFLDATHGGTAARSLALVAERFPARIAAASFVGGRPDLPAAIRPRAAHGRSDGRPAQARHRPARAVRPAARGDAISTSACPGGPWREQTLKSQVEGDGLKDQSLIDSEIGRTYPGGETASHRPYPLLKVQVSAP